MTRIFLNSPSQEENWYGGITDHDWRKGTSITVEQFCLCQVRSPMDRSEGAQLLLKVRLTAALWAHPRLYMWCVRPSWAVSAIQGAPTTPGPDVWKQADFKARQHSAYIPRWKLFFFFSDKVALVLWNFDLIFLLVYFSLKQPVYKTRCSLHGVGF